eukprot:TRINITY_DN622_c0_g1_i1.p1 TRINITY_DN622_c0_g1~~TRINITY_DN622_c0_g1_i1.p1  ORF type:complete len:433 (+),score=45.72 TRINITY_DN622_c0_g1_i1:23-1300(+)
MAQAESFGAACIIFRITGVDDECDWQLRQFLSIEDALTKRGVPAERIYKLLSPIITPEDVVQLLKCFALSTWPGREDRTDLVYIRCPAKTDGKIPLLRLAEVDSNGKPTEAEATLAFSEVKRLIKGVRPCIFYDTCFGKSVCHLMSALDRTEQSTEGGTRTGPLERPPCLAQAPPRQVQFRQEQPMSGNDPVIVYTSDPETPSPKEVAGLLGCSLTDMLLAQTPVRSLPQAVAHDVFVFAPRVLDDARHVPYLVGHSAVDEQSDGTLVPLPLDPVPQPAPDLQMSYIEDITLQDRAEVRRHKPFKKAWRVMNSGATNWPEGCALVPRVAFPFCRDVRVAAPPLPPGEQHVFEVELTIHREPCQRQYCVYWQMQLPDGRQFGETLSLIILVSEDSDPIVEPIATSISSTSDRTESLVVPEGTPRSY